MEFLLNLTDLTPETIFNDKKLYSMKFKVCRISAGLVCNLSDCFHMILLNDIYSHIFTFMMHIASITK